MASKHIGSATFALSAPPTLLGWGNIGGKKEGEGPLGALSGTLCGAGQGGTARLQPLRIVWRRSHESMYRHLLCRP